MVPDRDQPVNDDSNPEFVKVLVAAFAFTLAYGTIGFYVLDQIYERPFNLVEVWQQTFSFFTISSEPSLSRGSWRAA